MAMPNRDLRNNAAEAAAAARLLRQAREDVSAALLESGFVTSSLAARAGAGAATAAAASGQAEAEDSVLACRRALVAGCFIAGMSTMWAAAWVAGDPARRRAAGLLILCVSLVPMLIAFRLSYDLDGLDITLGA